jgi:hypothetical protein
VEAPLELSLQAPLDLLRHFLEVQPVNKAVYGEQGFGLFVIRIDLLREVDRANAGEPQVTQDIEGIPQIASNPR